MARINLSVSDDLRTRMRAAGGRINFSAVAQAAFREHLGLAPPTPASAPISDLPTTLPAKDGVLWNNGGMLCISGRG